MVRLGIRSYGERSAYDASGKRCNDTGQEALTLRGAAGWYRPAARPKGSARGDSCSVLEVTDALTVVLVDEFDCRNRCGDAWASHLEATSLESVPVSSRSMREHYRRSSAFGTTVRLDVRYFCAGKSIQRPASPQREL